MDDQNIDVYTVTRRSVKSIFALISRSFFLYIIQTAALLIIVSYLSPEDLGLYTAVIAIQRIISFFTDFGLGAALVQKKEELEREDITTSFTIQTAVTGVILVVVWLLRDVFASFFHLRESGMFLLLVLVFSIFLSSFKVIPSILLERKIQFQKLVIPQILESLTFNIILVVLILRGYGVTSYSWAFLVSSIISIPVYYYISPWPIGFGISKRSLTHLKYGSQFQAKNILATIKDDLLTVILIKFLPFAEIGFIGFAQRWAFFIFRFVVDSVTKVTFSTYARIHQDKEHLTKAIEKSLFFISATMFPLLGGWMITMPYIITLIPRWHKWEPSILSFVFFCLNAAISSLSSILVNVLDATGRVKSTLKLMVMWTVLVWTITPILVYFYGYNGVAIASFLVTLTIFITVRLVKQVVPFHFTKNIIKPVIATGIMSLFVYFFADFFVTDLLTLAFVILTGGAVYIAIMYIIAGKEVLGDIKSIFIKK